MIVVYAEWSAGFLLLFILIMFKNKHTRFCFDIMYYFQWLYILILKFSVWAFLKKQVCTTLEWNVFERMIWLKYVRISFFTKSRNTVTWRQPQNRFRRGGITEFSFFLRMSLVHMFYRLAYCDVYKLTFLHFSGIDNKLYLWSLMFPAIIFISAVIFSQHQIFSLLFFGKIFIKSHLPSLPHPPKKSLKWERVEERVKTVSCFIPHYP